MQDNRNYYGEKPRRDDEYIEETQKTYKNYRRISA